MTYAKLAQWGLIISAGFSIYAQSDLLPLPSSLADKQIYYHKTDQLNQVSCGYNALYNAVKLDHSLGNSNPYANLPTFLQACQQFATRNNIALHHSSTTAQLYQLALQLGLRNCHCLGLANGQIRAFFDTPTRVTYPAGTSQDTVDRMLEQEVQKRSDRLMQQLKTVIHTDAHASVHLVCGLKDTQGPHAVLVSIVKNSDNTLALHAYDNTNTTITPNSEFHAYLYQLEAFFNTDTPSQDNVEQEPIAQDQELPVIPEVRDAQPTHSKPEPKAKYAVQPTRLPRSNGRHTRQPNKPAGVPSTPQAPKGQAVAPLTPQNTDKSEQEEVKKPTAQELIKKKRRFMRNGCTRRTRVGLRALALKRTCGQKRRPSFRAFSKKRQCCLALLCAREKYPSKTKKAV